MIENHIFSVAYNRFYAGTLISVYDIFIRKAGGWQVLLHNMVYGANIEIQIHNGVLVSAYHIASSNT